MTDHAAHSTARDRLEALESELDTACEEVEHALSPPALAAVVLARVLRFVDADAGYVAVPDGTGGIQVARVTQFCDAPVRLAFPIDAPYPLAEAIRSRRTLFISSNEQLRCDHPGLVRVEEADHACATVPLVEDGELVGAVNLAFNEPHEFSDEERELIDRLARRCAAIVARARRATAPN